MDEVETQAVLDEGATDLRSELTSLLNRFSRENVSNTPDWILRDYMWNCLKSFERATTQRDAWYGMKPAPGRNNVPI